MPNNPKPDVRPRSFYSYLILGAALFAFIQTFSLLSPILLSFLLILLISLAVNPVISRMRALKGGRKGATGLIVAALVVVIALTGWAFFGPMKDSVTKLSEQLPAYWERLQKPLIKMEQQAVLSEEKLQAEVTTEIAQTATEEGKPEAARRTTETGSAKNHERVGIYSFQVEPDDPGCGRQFHGGGVQRGSDPGRVGDGLLRRNLYANESPPDFRRDFFDCTRAPP